MAEIAVLGTAAADVILRVDKLPERGDHVSGVALGWRLGGGSANVAGALASLGHDVELVGPVGGDPMGDLLLAELARRGVGTSGTFRVPEPSPRALILLDSTGERTIVGVDAPFSTRVYPLKTVPALPRVDALYVETWRRFPIEAAEGAAPALLVTTPPRAGGSPWPADVLVGSERDYPRSWSHDPFVAGREVTGGRLRWVVVTRGAKGADAYGPGGAVHVDAAPRSTEVIDTTGAGDAFAAGLLSGLVRGQSIEDAIALGTTGAARSMATLGSIIAEALEELDGAWPGA